MRPETLWPGASRSAPDTRREPRRSRRARRRRTSPGRRARARTRRQLPRRPRAPRPRPCPSARRAPPPARPSRDRPCAAAASASAAASSRRARRSPRRSTRPPRCRPARFVSRSKPESPRTISSCACGAPQPGQREAVADLDAFHGLDPHQRGGEPCVETLVARRVRAQAGRNAARPHLDDAADRVALLPCLVDACGEGVEVGDAAHDLDRRSPRAAPSRRRPRRPSPQSAARSRARARRRVVEPVLHRSRKVGVPGPRRRHGRRALA